jgi:hypothetical protein
MIDRLCAYANLSLFANVSAICDATKRADVLMFKRVIKERRAKSRRISHGVPLQKITRLCRENHSRAIASSVDTVLWQTQDGRFMHL